MAYEIPINSSPLDEAIKKFNEHEFEGRTLVVREDQYVERKKAREEKN